MHAALLLPRSSVTGSQTRRLGLTSHFPALHRNPDVTASHAFASGARHGHAVSANYREDNSQVVKWHLMGLMDNSHLWRFFSVRKHLGEN
eukprot:527195-Pyramimonas_sp.AAC.1